MKSMFWREVEGGVKVETGMSITFLEDLNMYVMVGGVKAEIQKKEGAPQAKKNPFASKNVSTVQEKVQQIEEVWVCVVGQNKWKIQTCSGKHPPQRVHQYMNYCSPYLLVYGGMDKKLYSDIYLLNCHNWVWKKLVVLDSHIPRLHGCMIPYVNAKNNKRYLIGGASSLENIDVLNDVWVLSLQGVIDSNNNELPGAFWSKIQLNSEFIPVKNFTANLIEEDKAFLFGGFTSNSISTNNSYTFNMSNNKMTLLQTKGVKPSPRGNHKSCLIKPKILIFMGGQQDPKNNKFFQDIFIFHSQINTWQKIIPGGNSPFNSTPFCITSQVNKSKGQLLFLNTSSNGTNSQYILQELVKDEQLKVIEDNESQKENITEELKQGYELNEDQKKKIQQLQQKVQATKQKNIAMKQKIEKLRTEPLPSAERFTSNKTQLSSRLLQLLLLEHKKRKFLELKSLMLQNTIKDTSKLVVMLNGFSEPEAKSNHIKVMKDYRLDMQQIQNKQKLLRKEIASKNNLMGLDLKKLFVESLSVQQNTLLSLIL